MKRQSLMLVVIGVVLFIAGGGIAFVTVNNSAKKQPTTTIAPPVSSPAVIALADVPAGTTGKDMVAKGLVAVQLVPQKKFLPTDLPNLQGLTDQTLATPLVKGQAVQTTDLSPTASAISVPAGLDAVSVTTTGVAGLAGYLAPGSDVDVYANINKVSTTPTGAPLPAVALPCTELVMSNIEVLDVSEVVPSLNTGTDSSTAATAATGATATATTTTAPAAAPPARTIPPTLTVLLAVTPAQAQEITFMTQNETLSVAQTQTGATPPALSVCTGTGQYTAIP